jgi:hypothetical protein
MCVVVEDDEACCLGQACCCSVWEAAHRQVNAAWGERKGEGWGVGEVCRRTYELWLDATGSRKWRCWVGAGGGQGGM